jgi:hypothetical protein
MKRLNRFSVRRKVDAIQRCTKRRRVCKNALRQRKVGGSISVAVRSAGTSDAVIVLRASTHQSMRRRQGINFGQSWPVTYVLTSIYTPALVGRSLGMKGSVSNDGLRWIESKAA